MKQVKQRVIALDYFRGLFMIMVLLNHALIFSLPFAMLAGAGIMWTSAAEMFLIISGVTFWIVRSNNIRTDFSGVMKKTFRRAAYVYILDIAVVLVSLLLSLYLTSHGYTNDVDGSISQKHGLGLLADILTFKYSLGWANFLMYYSVLLLFAAPALYILSTKMWKIVPLLSLAIFTYFSLNANHIGVYGTFGIWQVYFFLGLTLGRLRLPILSAYNKLSSKTASLVARTLAFTGLIVLALSAFLEFNIYPTVVNLTNAGWLPAKSVSAYTHYLHHKSQLDHLLVNSRAGMLRPLIAVLVLATFYVIYQRYNRIVLRYTGSFINNIGANTLWIFVAQAIAIPLLAALPLQRNHINNFLLSAFLVLSMWAISQRRRYSLKLKFYAAELKASYSEAKYAYLQQYEDSN